LWNTFPSIIIIGILETRGGVPELLGLYPVRENPVGRIFFIGIVLLRILFKEFLENYNGIFPGPVSLRKTARNLKLY
jgi:hypothetical protein